MYSEKPLLHAREKSARPEDLRTIAFDTTPRCTMRCTKCYAETFAKVTPLELPIVARVLDEAYEMGCMHYVFQGGEPIEDKERLAFFLENCHPEATYINVISNGWRMDQETIAWLKARQVDKITFSLDSGIEAEHDADRAPGSYQRVLKAIDHVLAEGLLTGVSIVVTHQSLYQEGFQRVYDFALNKRIRLDVQIAEPVGNWDGRKDLLITPEDAQYIQKLREKSPRLPNGQEMVKRDLYTGGEDNCPAGTRFIGITADGEVLPCNFLQYSLGNVRDKSLQKMRADLLTNAWFSGDHPRCIIGEDPEFFDRFVSPHVGKPKPLNAYQTFNLISTES
ncbi:MAG: radical SAM protein [Magnetococcales bacterium]|nr:radical SAM protein [Magnetococcales bacterium]